MPTIVEPSRDNSGTPRPVDVLRRASTQMRWDWPLPPQAWQSAAWTAVADWLDACAVVLDVSPGTHKAHALRVASAYLDGVA